MRTIGIFLSTLAIAFCAVAIGETQQPRRPGGGGFGQGQNPLSLIQNEQVQKELNLTEEQIKKLPDAVQKAIAEVLDAKQAKRLKQIQLQQRGSQALTDAAVAKELKISESQKEKINTILADSRKEMQELFQGGAGRGNLEKLTTLRKETREKVLNVLSDEQKKAYQEMTGEEFKMQFGGFQKRGEGKGKGTPRKKRANKAE
jgi:Spy/CpxP family protein refolding chaperone